MKKMKRIKLIEIENIKNNPYHGKQIIVYESEDGKWFGQRFYKRPLNKEKLLRYYKLGNQGLIE